MRGHSNYINRFILSNNRIISASADYTLKVWPTHKYGALPRPLSFGLAEYSSSIHIIGLSQLPHLKVTTEESAACKAMALKLSLDLRMVMHDYGILLLE